MIRRPPPDTFAAIDLGSNSFHMIVVRVEDGEIRVLDKIKETVRLAKGLDEHNMLSEQAIGRALECLSRFGQRVGEMPRGSVRVVGTNTLRKANNSTPFLVQAQLALGHPIDIISGVEEARLIYLGVSHSLASDGEKRLVVDIGGGSTELIIGEGFEPRRMESLYMGCVSLTEAYFPEGRITEKNWRKAVTAARIEIRPISRSYRRMGWQESVGASGTLLAVAKVVREMGWSEEGITLQSLYSLRDAMIEAGKIKNLVLAGLSKDRAIVFPGGVAVLQGVFEGLRIGHMSVSEGALREGVIYDLLGRVRQEDVRSRTINSLMTRFNIDAAHVERIRDTLHYLFERVADVWQLDEDHADVLDWALSLHEIGLAIAHAQFQKHGAYLIENADMPGFSRQEQQVLATLIRTHRRKFPIDIIKEFSSEQSESLTRLVVLLRLAVLLHRSRGEYDIPIKEVDAKNSRLKIKFDEGFLDDHPLTRVDLKNENTHLSQAGFKLKFE